MYLFVAREYKIVGGRFVVSSRFPIFMSAVVDPKSLFTIMLRSLFYSARLLFVGCIKMLINRVNEKKPRKFPLQSVFVRLQKNGRKLIVSCTAENYTNISDPRIRNSKYA